MPSSASSRAPPVVQLVHGEPLTRCALQHPTRFDAGCDYLGELREAANLFQMNSTTIAPRVAAMKPAP